MEVSRKTSWRRSVGNTLDEFIGTAQLLSTKALESAKIARHATTGIPLKRNKIIAIFTLVRWDRQQ
jgi:hypothetical protein